MWKTPNKIKGTLGFPGGRLCVDFSKLAPEASERKLQDLSSEVEILA